VEGFLFREKFLCYNSKRIYNEFVKMCTVFFRGMGEEMECWRCSDEYKGFPDGLSLGVPSVGSTLNYKR
jgi:hypothetical protein